MRGRSSLGCDGPWTRRLAQLGRKLDKVCTLAVDGGQAKGIEPPTFRPSLAPTRHRQREAARKVMRAVHAVEQGASGRSALFRAPLDDCQPSRAATGAMSRLPGRCTGCFGSFEGPDGAGAVRRAGDRQMRAAATLPAKGGA
jgi:hypothetical protein